MPAVARGVHQSASEGWSGRRGSNPRPTAWKAVTLPLSYSRLRAHRLACRRALLPRASAGKPAVFLLPTRHFHSPARSAAAAHLLRTSSARPTFRAPNPRGRGWWGGEGSNLRSPKAAGLQPAAIDRSATSPKYISCCSSGHDCFGSQFLYPLRPWAAALRPAHVIGIRVRCIPEGRREINPWSWRRDLNPRPADYKSAALPD